jgi:UDP-N-acetyl-D-mannosaminuronic acid dehydrogenase
MEHTVTDNRVCVLGMGYVGLTLAVVMAERGFKVYGAEINKKVFGQISDGSPHFFEQGLEIRLKRALKAGTLRFVERVKDIPRDELPSAYVITVGTPLDADYRPRMDMVSNVAAEVAAHMPTGSLVILRSTVRLGTTRAVVLKRLRECGKAFGLAYCPERTLEGKALEELTSLPQIVGGLSDSDLWRATSIFQRLTPTIIKVSSLEAAEIIKLLDNSYRDHMFAFGNEVALLCDAAGLDGIEVIRAANTGYERTKIAMPGFVGGPCLHKDPHILQDSLTDFNYVPSLIKEGRALNESLSDHVIDMILRDMPDGASLVAPKIAICGVAFKGRPETDDTRATPALELIAALRSRFPDAAICGHDFAVRHEAIAELGITPVDIEGAFCEANVVIVANNNAKYQWVNLDALAASMKRPSVVFDVWSVLPMDEKAVEVEGVAMRRLGSAKAWGRK